MTKLYEDRVTGLLAEDTFTSLLTKNEAERLESEKRLSLLETSKQEAAERLSDIQKWIRLIKENSTALSLNRDLLESLIEKIEIGESKVIGGVKEQEVRIFYRFIGEMK